MPKIPCCETKPFVKCTFCSKVVCKRCMRKGHMKVEHDQQVCTIGNFVAGWTPITVKDEQN